MSKQKMSREEFLEKVSCLEMSEDRVIKELTSFSPADAPAFYAWDGTLRFARDGSVGSCLNGNWEPYLL